MSRLACRRSWPSSPRSSCCSPASPRGGYGIGGRFGAEGAASEPISGNAAAVADGRQAGPALEFGDFKRAFARFRKDQITDNAAALTYYSLLSLFPALLFCAALLGVFGQQAPDQRRRLLPADAGAPQDTVDAVTGALESAQEQRGTAIVALIIGLATRSTAPRARSAPRAAR